MGVCMRSFPHLVPDGLPYFLPVRIHAGVLGLPLVLLLPQRLLPLLLLLGRVGVLLLLAPQHLTHVLGGPWKHRKSHGVNKCNVYLYINGQPLFGVFIKRFTIL